MDGARRPSQAVLRQAQARLGQYDLYGYTALHGSTAVPETPPRVDELSVHSWQQDGCAFDVVAARGVALIYVDGRLAEEVLHPTQAFRDAVEARHVVLSDAVRRYSGWH